MIITRFAPSPTGFLHIGGARTALFNALFAHRHGGTYLLRVEDTDRERSTQEAIDAIVSGLDWLGLSPDQPPVFQSAHAGRHREIAEELLAAGKAYRCYCTPEELAVMREEARTAGRTTAYDGRWRERDPGDAPAGQPYTIRIKSPQSGEYIIEDAVQGKITVSHNQLDDFILLRADGTPTYMLAVVVDDHDMGITHIIRGDDHLNNAFRQRVIYEAMGWDVPVFAHIPLIHGPDGAKLSKRHGALGVEAYREMGYLPEAMRNYLLRLGWAHGDDEIISDEEAASWFGLEGIGKAPARFDMAKLDHLNGHYIREAEDERLLAAILPQVEKEAGAAVDSAGKDRLRRGLAGLKERAKTLTELAGSALFYVQTPPLPLTEKAAGALASPLSAHLPALAEALAALPETEWKSDVLRTALEDFAASRELKPGKLMPLLRAALTGQHGGPDMFEIMEILGKPSALERIYSAAPAELPSAASS